MKVILGIDIGGSTTKIMGFRDDTVINPLIVKAADAVTSIFGALGKFVSINGFSLDHIEQIMVTGVGSSFIKDKIYGIPTAKVDEFLAVGLGGLYLSGMNKALIVSMGTGTAFIMAEGDDVKHYGGTGIGGGTLLGLSSCAMNLRDFDSIMKMAETGDIRKINLTVGDITKDKITTLPPNTTASNFGKMSDMATKNDIAMGIVNMVFESIGMQAIFASRIDNIGDIVLTGNLTTASLAWSIFNQLMDIFPERFYLPENAEYATAFGAALAYKTERRYTQMGM